MAAAVVSRPNFERAFGRSKYTVGMLRAAVLLVGVSLGVSAVSTDTLTVSAAVSLTDVMQAIASAYERAGGGRITFNFAASNVLARQVANGAPVDVFISADEAQMDLVSKSGRIEAGSRLPVARNQLAVVVRIDATGLLTSPFPRDPADRYR